MRRIVTILVLTLAILSFGSMGFAEALPATFFGMHINQSTTPWPNVGFGSYRLWDDGTGWATINSSKGVYNWSTLDSWVSKAQQHNVQLTYTFGRTPNWASSSPATACNYGPGQCVAPADYANWDDFVTAIATRYKGKIKYYEMWNEPNISGFWKGTTAELVIMTNRMATIIHAVDPAAKVMSPPCGWATTDAPTCLDGFLTAGGGAQLDVISFHVYTNNTNAESVFSIIDKIQKVETAHGLVLPLVLSEGGWGYNTVIPDLDAQAAFLVQRYLLITARPAVKAFYWYQWDNSVWGTLWDSSNGIHKAGVAYGQLTAWLIGSTANGCSKGVNSTWTCSFTQPNGNAAVAVWNATASVSYTPGAEYNQALAIDGSSTSIDGSKSYTVSNKPVLFTAIATAAPSATLSVTPNTGIAPVSVSASVSASAAPGLTVKSTSITFGDGTIVNASSGNHTYANPGSYTVLATVTDSLNRAATSSKTVTVSANQPPQAALSVSPASGTAPLTVTGSSAASKDADGSIASSSINFGDGTVVNASTSAHTYTTAGTYKATATVKDNLGASSTATVTVTVTAPVNQPPIAKLVLTQSGATVTASTAGSYDPDGKIASTVINWGDGSTTIAASGSRTYTKSGTYNVSATVTDNSGASASSIQSVIVKINQAPVAVMTLTKTAAVSYKVSATGSYDPDGTIASTTINWGDGVTTAATSGSHTYSKPGTYTVTVKVTDNNGATASTSGSATANWGIFVVSPNPLATSASTVHIAAYAAASYGIGSTKILVDGKTVYTGTSWLIDTSVSMTKGIRNIVLQAISKTGVQYQSALSITVQ